MKKFIKIISCVVVVLLIIVAGGSYIMGKQSNDALAKQVTHKIDMTKIPDGTYKGNSDGGMVKVEVSVNVKNHKINNIDIIKHDNGRGKPAEAMIDDMVKENTYDVDTVSGATISSKTIKNAVNVALYNGMTN